MYFSMHKMALMSSLFICLFVISASFAEECKLLSTCKCVFENGFGIDLSGIITNDQPVKSSETNSLTYYFHPCSNYRGDWPPPNTIDATGVDDCKNGFSMCLHDRTNNSLKNVGQAKEATFVDGPESLNNPHINYYRYSHNQTSTTVMLVCTEVNRNDLIADPNLDSKSHSLVLYSHEACLRDLSTHGLSGFGIFMIVILTLIFTYLFIGVMWNRIMLGARGVEMIPNLEFWRSVPGKVTGIGLSRLNTNFKGIQNQTNKKAAVDFLKNGCKRNASDTRNLNPNSYDAI